MKGIVLEVVVKILTSLTKTLVNEKLRIFLCAKEILLINKVYLHNVFVSKILKYIFIAVFVCFFWKKTEVNGT